LNFFLVVLFFDWFEKTRFVIVAAHLLAQQSAAGDGLPNAMQLVRNRRDQKNICGKNKEGKT
jgi:hypothetical protein